jgi:hypothetical protein
MGSVILFGVLADQQFARYRERRSSTRQLDAMRGAGSEQPAE